VRDGQPTELRLRASAAPGASATQPRAAANTTCHYGLDRQVNRRVRMSDVHGWVGVSSTYQYAADHSADSYIGVAIQTPSGHWQASGTDHVTNTKVFGQTATIGGRGDKRVTGIFKFNILKLRGRNCPKGTLKGFTRAYRFEGGMRVEKTPAAAGLSGHCDTAAGHQRLYPRTTVFTSTAHSLSYDRALTIFGVTLGSTSTFSKNVQITLSSHTNRVAWVCGLSQSGQAVPIADAAMLYAGPRISRK
jgi:hypothetical protein